MSAENVNVILVCQRGVLLRGVASKAAFLGGIKHVAPPCFVMHLRVIREVERGLIVIRARLYGHFQSITEHDVLRHIVIRHLVVLELEPHRFEERASNFFDVVKLSPIIRKETVLEINSFSHMVHVRHASLLVDLVLEFVRLL